MDESKVMKLSEFEYRIACMCRDPNCDLYINIDYEIDKTLNPPYINTNLVFYRKLTCACFYKSYQFQRFIWRIKTCLQILFKGYIEVESEFILEGKSHVKDMIDVLQDAYNQIDKE